MTLLAPYWLFAASAILVPIAIHLWNKRQGKTVKVGSLRWLEASASKQWSRIRLTDVGLLLLRCLILLLLVFALADPVIENHPTGKAKGSKAVYISPGLLHSKALTTIKPTVDNLLLRGYSLHAFEPAFSTISKEHWAQLSTTPTDSVVGNGNHWALLPALAERYPLNQDSVWLFTSDQQRHYKGEPAPLQENITWVPIALEDSLVWIYKAYAAGADSVQLIVGKSSRQGTSYSRHSLSRRTGRRNIDGLQIQLLDQNDSLWIYDSKQEQQKVLVQEQPSRISIFADKAQQSEVRYLSAAIAAISNHTGVPLKTTEAPADSTTKWLFWFSDAALPDSLLELVEQGISVWVQPGSEPSPTKARFVAAGNALRLHQVSLQEANYDKVVWAATNGEPLLTSQLSGKGRIYHFRSGFSPKWSNLGQSAQLPELLLPLLLPQTEMTKYDARAMPESLLKPTLKKALPVSMHEEQQTKLLPWLVLAAFLFFILERIIAGKRVKI